MLSSTMNSGQAASRPRRPRRLRRSALAGALGAAVLVMALPGNANADVLQLLPQNADGLEQTFSPAYDCDTDGCYATAAIGIDGTVNPGLPLGGDVNGHCHDYAQLANANTYSREKCNNDWCAVMYAGYFEKDQATLGPAAIGHTHDWDKLMNADFGEATIKITDGNFDYALAHSIPAGIPFGPNA
jgi:hypothetical protein